MELFWWQKQELMVNGASGRIGVLVWRMMCLFASRHNCRIDLTTNDDGWQVGGMGVILWIYDLEQFYPAVWCSRHCSAIDVNDLALYTDLRETQETTLSLTPQANKATAGLGGNILLAWLCLTCACAKWVLEDP